MQGFFTTEKSQSLIQTSSQISIQTSDQPPAHLEAIGTVHWDKVLRPDIDEETTRHQNQERIRKQEEENAIANRNHIMPRTIDPIKVHKPSASFKVKGNTFFILEGNNSRVETRVGVLGHYLCPYHIGPQGRAIPYPTPRTNTPIPVLKHGDPGISLNNTVIDGQPRPNNLYCLHGIHFVRAEPITKGVNPAYYEIGIDTLQESLEKAEDMDHEFALKIQGYTNVSSTEVWDCIDSDFDPTDRKTVMNQFMGKYLDRFYSHMDTGNEPDTRDVVAEALHKFKSFCQAWVQKHYKTLTPMVTSAAEGLTGDFFVHLKNRIGNLTRMELTRIFMRHPDISPEFASCLYYFMTSLEQTRGGRNASYKQMNTVSTFKNLNYKRFGEWLSTNLHMLTTLFTELEKIHNNHFHPLIVDWYSIAGQMPQVHRYFDYTPNIDKGVTNTQSIQGPPWRFGRT